MNIIFEFNTDYGTFRDALNLPDDNTYSEAEIAQMKQQRLDNWLAIVSTLPTE